MRDGTKEQSMDDTWDGQWNDSSIMQSQTVRIAISTHLVSSNIIHASHKNYDIYRESRYGMILKIATQLFGANLIYLCLPQGGDVINGPADISEIEAKVRSQTEAQLRQEFEAEQRKLLEEQQRLLEHEKQEKEMTLRREREHFQKEMREQEERVKAEVEERLRIETEEKIQRELQERERALAEEYSK